MWKIFLLINCESIITFTLHLISGKRHASFQGSLCVEHLGPTGGSPGSPLDEFVPHNKSYKEK